MHKLAGARRWSVAVVGAALALAGCGDDGPTEPAAQEVALDELGPTGVATSFETLTTEQIVNEDWPDPVEPPDGELELTGCRWRGPGLVTYDLHWSSDDALEYPLSFTLELVRFHGDEGEGTQGLVTLSGPGDLSVTEDTYVVDRVVRARGTGEPPAWEASRHAAVNERGETCEANAGTEPPTAFEQVDMEVDLAEVILDGPEGTVEGLAAGVDLTDADDPWLPLAFLLRLDDRPTVDRLFLSDTWRLDLVEIIEDGACLEVRSLIVPAEAPAGMDERRVDITQRAGCEAPHPISDEEGYTEETVDDEVWDVRVTGATEDVAEVLPTIVAAPFAGVDRLPPRGS